LETAIGLMVSLSFDNIAIITKVFNLLLIESDPCYCFKELRFGLAHVVHIIDYHYPLKASLITIIKKQLAQIPSFLLQAFLYLSFVVFVHLVRV
jgi:hypothetical protein